MRWKADRSGGVRDNGGRRPGDDVGLEGGLVVDDRVFLYRGGDVCVDLSGINGAKRVVVFLHCRRDGHQG